jgi:DNA-binding NtrC family response regulator
VALDVRIIAATNQNLEAMVRQGTFRADLLFRLNVIRIELPPLRERRDDIPVLLDQFADHFNAKWGPRIEAIDHDCRAALASYDWPGNVRELKNVVEALYVNSRGGTITRRDLPPAFRELAANTAPIDERRTLVDALYAMNWNVSRVAEKLQWSRMTVYRKLARYRISREAALCDSV